MPGERKKEMTYTKKEVANAIKTLRRGTSNKFKYVEAKDMVIEVAMEYVSGSLIFSDPKREGKLKERKSFQKPKYHKTKSTSKKNISSVYIYDPESRMLEPL
jgi:hypothetical protein